MIPDDQKNTTTQCCSTGRHFTAAAQASLSYMKKTNIELIFIEIKVLIGYSKVGH